MAASRQFSPADNYDELVRQMGHAICTENTDALSSLISLQKVDLNKKIHFPLPLQHLTESKREAFEDYYPHNSQTFLILALIFENKRVISILLDAGADVNGTDTYGSTPLEHACTYNNYQVVDLLIKKGADVSTRNNANLTPLHHTFSNKLSDQTFQIIKLLIDNGADVNVRDTILETPIFSISDSQYAENDAKKLIKFLHDNKFDMKIRDHKGCSFLHHLVGINNLSLLMAALPYCDAEAVDCYGRTFLHHWFYKPHKVTETRKVIPYGNVNQEDLNGLTPLWIAISRNYIDDVKLLLDHKADFHHIDKFGMNVMSYARCEDMRNVLLQHGCVSRPSKYAAFPLERRSPAILFAASYITKDSTIKSKTSQLNRENLIKALQTPLSGFFHMRVAERHEACHISNCVSLFMSDICSRMGHEDPAMAVDEIILSGSVSEGTKVHQPDEFDYVFKLSRFQDLMQIPTDWEFEQSFARLRCKGTAPSDMKDLFDENQFLVSEKFLRRFYRTIVSVVTKKAKLAKYPHMTLGSLLSDENAVYGRFKISYLQIFWHSSVFPWITASIDMVPAIMFPSWYPPWCRACPMLKENGCYYVPKRIKHAPLSIRLNLFTFNSCEGSIIQQMPLAMKEGYMLAKYMRHQLVCPVIGADDKKTASETDDDEQKTASDILPSYFLKTCILWKHAEHDGGLVENTLDNRIYYALGIYKRLNRAFKKRSLPMFLIPDKNLLSGNSDDEIELGVLYCKLLQQLIRDPMCFVG